MPIEIPPHPELPEEEREHITLMLQSGSLFEPLKKYESTFRFVGMGGSGVVLSAQYLDFKTLRAFKLPRKRVYDELVKNPDAPHEDPEAEALARVRHRAIPSLHLVAPLAKAGQCIVTDLVEAPASLEQWAVLLCKDAFRDAEERCAVLRRITLLVREIVDAMQYMHETARLLHFDLKPANLLVAQSGHVFVTDLGFAKDRDRHAAEPEVRVGFTSKYAHPSLHSRQRISATSNKASNRVPGSFIHPRLDLFAFGRTLQEVLFRVRTQMGDVVYSDFLFRSLHLVACLCLDGENSADTDERKKESFVSDRALGLPLSVFKRAKCESFAQVAATLERVLGRTSIEQEVPELDRWGASTINVSDLGVTPLTRRLRSLIDHPVLERLGSQLQLGMLDTVFPTVTHSRLQHTLGAYHAVGQYLQALYHDPDNPTFRVLVTADDCARVLLCSLLHDIGHTHFGHDLEEVDKEEFSHEAIGEVILKKSHAKDGSGRTVRDLISGSGAECWGISVESVLGLLTRAIDHPLDAVLVDLISGQLDADKLDYLIRDAKEARVAYGAGIDHERLFRSLTTAVSDGEDDSLHLTVRRKGTPSAEAFALARYQLYQAVYWHHTFRAIKAMLLTAAGMALKQVAEKTDALKEEGGGVRDTYIRHVIGLDVIAAPPVDRTRRSGGSARKGVRAELEERLSKPDPSWMGRYGGDRTLRFLWKIAGDAHAQGLIEDLMNRRYYRRVIEVPLGSLGTERAWLSLVEKFKNTRLTVEDAVSKALLVLVRKGIQDRAQETTTLEPIGELERLEVLCQTRPPFLVDLPLRGWSGGGRRPLFLDDYRRRYFGENAARVAGTVGTLWDQIDVRMREAACFRVFAHPDVHRILVRVVRVSEVRQTVNEAVPELRPAGP